MALSAESKLKEILEDPRGVAIMDEIIPGLTSHPQLKLGKVMSLRKVAALTGKITDEQLEAADKALKALE